MSECIRCIQIKTERKVLSCRQRQAVAVALAGIIHCIDVVKRLSICHLCIKRTVIPVHVRGLRQGLTRLLISQVLVINIIQTLAENTLSSPVDTQEIEIETKVNTHSLSELEILVKHIDQLATGSLQIICIQSLLVRIHDELHSRIIFCRVRRCLHTSIRKVVAQPHERNTTSENTDTSTKDIFTVLLNIPTETYTRAPHRCTGKFLIGFETISLTCCYGEENPELVRDRARGLRLPETGDFRLGYVEFDEQASTSKAGYMVLQLRAWSNVANYGVMQYQNSVLILFQDWHDYPVGEQLLFRERWDELLTLLGKNHAHIGVSLLFTELGRLRMGYDQARTAIEIGRKLDPDALEYHYSKYYLNDMLECYREKFALDDVIVRYLDQLAGERGYSNSNLLLLYHYLNTERNISLTAKRVHMHRNSVIYRLQRIQDVLNLDLDDPDVRLRLMITFKILRMEGKLPEITDEPPEPDNGGSDRLTLVE